MGVEGLEGVLDSDEEDNKVFACKVSEGLGLAGPLAEEEDMERFRKAVSTPALVLRVVVAITG